MKVHIARNRRGEFSATISLSRRNLVYLLARLDGTEEGEPRITSSTAYPETVITAEEDDRHYDGGLNDIDDDAEEVEDDALDERHFDDDEDDEEVELPQLAPRRFTYRIDEAVPPLPPVVRRGADAVGRVNFEHVYRAFGVDPAAAGIGVHDEVIVRVEEDGR